MNMKANLSRIILLGVILALAALFFSLDLGRYLSLDYLKTSRSTFADYYAAHRFETLAIYAGLYILATALSLPGATVMTLAGGALFGLGTGFVVISFASTIGATLAFAASRFLLRNLVQRRFGDRLRVINEGVAREGAFYLFSLRLVPLFPFFLINLAMGLTPMKTRVYYLVSQVGMIPGTLVYVNAGTQLGQLQSLSGILSPGLILSFALLGLLPLLSKKLLEVIKGGRNR